MLFFLIWSLCVVHIQLEKVPNKITWTARAEHNLWWENGCRVADVWENSRKGAKVSPPSRKQR
jgi:hypothetical protein